MKLIISTIVVGIVLFMLGWLFYGIVFAEYFKQYFGYMSRSETDMRIWAFGVASFFQALLLYIIYSKGYQGGSPIAEGIKFGILIGLFTGVPYVFFTWGGMPVHYKAVITDGCIMIAMMIIAGVITGIIHGRRPVPKTS